MEDAATAEISRSQLWQWIRHEAPIADDGTMSAQGYKDVRERVLATLRTDAPLFRNIDEIRWRGPTSTFAAVAERIGDARLLARVVKLQNS